MSGPGGAFALVALQLVGGTFLALILTRISFPIINRGYYRSTMWVLWPLMVASALTMGSQLRVLGLITGATYLVYLIAVYSQRPLIEWSSSAVAFGMTIWLSMRAGGTVCAQDCGLGLLHTIIGLVFMGAVTHEMVLGHWYLNQARLPIEPLVLNTRVLFGALAASVVTGIATRNKLLVGTVPGGVFAFGSNSYWWVWVLLIAGTALLTAMIYSTVKDRSTQSATGLAYIAVVVALAAQFLMNLLAAT